MTDTKNMKERICGRMKITRTNPMLKSLLMGICAYAIVGIILILVFLTDKWWNFLGFAIGIVLAIFMVIHMSKSIDVAVHQDENGALKHTRIMYIVRVALVVGALVSMIIWKYANPVTTLFGLFSLKFSAYIQLIAIKNKK